MSMLFLNWLYVLTPIFVSSCELIRLCGLLVLFFISSNLEDRLVFTVFPSDGSLIFSDTSLVVA